MTQEEREKKKKKRQQQQQILVQEETADDRLQRLRVVLEELAKEAKYVDIQICPHCKSVKIRRVGSMEGDMSGHMGLTPPKFKCVDCGWRERLAIYATNRPFGLKHISVIAETVELDTKNESAELSS